jgi:Uma2 family endonuclease
MGVAFRNADPMTAAEFFAFTATRADAEKWELIDGEPVLNATATRLHQRIVMNLLMALGRLKDELRPNWEVIPGIGIGLSEQSVPVPDIIVRPDDDLTGVECEDMIVAFEVLSPSTADRDLRWKRKAYASLPSLQHYIVVAQDVVEVVVYDRETGFAERRLERMTSSLDISALGVSVALAAVYRDLNMTEYR